jgi:hypothetical protein
MEIPNTFERWLSDQAVPLAVIVGLVAFVMIVLWVSARNRRVRMNRTRSGTNEDTFVESLVVYGFDPQISSTVYRYLQEKQNVHFPIEATDLLDEDLGLDMVDLDETVRDVFQLTRRLYQPGLRHTPLVTVEDLVRFVQASPRIIEQAA